MKTSNSVDNSPILSCVNTVYSPDGEHSLALAALKKIIEPWEYHHGIHVSEVIWIENLPFDEERFLLVGLGPDDLAEILLDRTGNFVVQDASGFDVQELQEKLDWYQSKEEIWI